MTNIIQYNFQGYQVSFNNNGWINATEVASHFGKRLDNWLANKETQEYIEALALELNTLNSSNLNTPKKGDLIKTKRGVNGGTWLHPKLAVYFARWLSVKFAVWCDMQLDNLIRNGKLWKDSRRESALGYRAMSDAVLLVRQALGKEVKRHHFMNEARLINGIMTGVYKGRDRSELSREELDLVIMLENRNTLLIGMGKDYPQRKGLLTEYLAQLTRKAIAA